MAVLNNSNAISTTGGYNLTNSLRFRASASAYLSRTPSVAGNRNTWTWSAWVKRGTLGSSQTMFAAYPSSTVYAYMGFTSSDQILYASTGSGASLTTTAVYRDPSAWYHIVFVYDDTQATSSNRLKLYVNGVQVTAFGTATYPTLNFGDYINSAFVHNINRFPSGVQYTDGYLTELNFIDGQALTPSSFGSTNATTGVWQPARYTGTYGTNGFYLPFTDNSALTTTTNVGLGKDFSGNANRWTTNNISITAGTTYDSMTDVPTNTSATASNYCTLNPLNTGLAPLWGNLAFSQPSAAWVSSGSTMLQTTGKWYFEGFMGTIGGANYIGIGLKIAGPVGVEYAGQVVNSWGLIANSANYNTYTNNTAINAGSYTATTATAFQVAVDFDAGKIWFGFNNTWIGGGSPSAGTSPTYTFTANTELQPILSGFTNTNYINFGQRTFSYTPPTNFLAWNTFNLSTPTILQGNRYMDATLYTGNLTGQSITNAAAFKPDLVWIKSRSAATDNKLTDSLRGATLALVSNSNAAETTDLTGLTAFNANGFTVGASTTYNNAATTYVGWQWQAGQGSTSSNTSGTITSTVSVNATAGFSIATFNSGAAGNKTVGHGLGVAPALWIVKQRTGAASSWSVGSKALAVPAARFLALDLTVAVITDTRIWANTAPSSTVLSFESGYTLGANQDCVAYCWAEIAGFSKFGSYTGNVSTNGPFVYTGFRPKFILIKRTDDGTAGWWIWDSARNTYNAANTIIGPNTSSAEFTGAFEIDLLSNGFKLRTANSALNGGTVIYAAFAENPFKNANAR